MINSLNSATLIPTILNRKAKQLANLEFIFTELATRVTERLNYIKLNPQVILECGSGLGYDNKLLANRYPDAEIYAVDYALEILKQQLPKHSLINKLFRTKQNKLKLINADAQNLPFANQTIDFCYSNLMLPYLANLNQFIREMRRVLRLGGGFCLTGLGVDSFKEIRELGLMSYNFPDMHDIGDILLNAGFTNPVVDTEYITIEYDSLATLLNEIRLIGCGGAYPQLISSTLTKTKFKQLQQKFAQPTKLTLELFVAHGWKDSNHLDLPKGQQAIQFHR